MWYVRKVLGFAWGLMGCIQRVEEVGEWVGEVGFAWGMVRLVEAWVSGWGIVGCAGVGFVLGEGVEVVGVSVG